MATKIDTIKLGTSEYEIDLKSTATPSIASLTTSTLTVNGTSNLKDVKVSSVNGLSGNDLPISSHGGDIQLTSNDQGSITINTSNDLTLVAPKKYITVKESSTGDNMSIQPTYLLSMTLSGTTVYFEILCPIKKFLDAGFKFTSTISGTGDKLIDVTGFKTPIYLKPLCIYENFGGDESYQSGLFEFYMSNSGNTELNFKSMNNITSSTPTLSWDFRDQYTFDYKLIRFTY